MLSISCAQTLNEATNLIAVNGAATIEHQITTFYCIGKINDANRATAVSTVDLGEPVVF
ncbi:MAG: hypothetical protein ABI865_14080 [Nitrosospira sp.]